MGSSIALVAQAGNERNMAADPNPPPPPLVEHAVFLHDVYLEPEPESPLRRHGSRSLPFLFRTGAWCLLAILAVACIVVVMWLMFHPNFPKLQVVSAAVFSPAGSPTAAAAECNITFLLENPNRHLTIVYDRMEIAVVYPSHNVLLAHDYRPPLEQPGRSRATIEINLSFNGVDFASNVVKAMVEDVVLGSLTLAIKVHAVVWFRNGKWKTSPQFMRAYCPGLSFVFAPRNKTGMFLNPCQECGVYLYAK